MSRCSREEPLFRCEQGCRFPIVLLVALGACWPEPPPSHPTDTATHDTASPGDDSAEPAVTDGDGDGWAVEEGDCDDSDATVYPH